MMVAVQYKSAISTCMGIDVIAILSVSEVSDSSSQKPVKQWSSCKTYTHSLNSAGKTRTIQIHISNCNIFTRKEEL